MASRFACAALAVAALAAATAAAPARGGASRASAQRSPHLHVSVRPGSIIAGQRTRLRVSVTLDRKPLRGAQVRGAGHRVRTGRHGIARFSVLAQRGTVRITASYPRVQGGEVRVPVVRRR